MWGSYIKYFGIIFGSCYMYEKLLHLKQNNRKMLLNLIYALITAALMCVILMRYKLLIIPALAISLFVFLTRINQTERKLSVTTTLLSISLNYIVNFISAFLAAAVFGLCNLKISGGTEILNSACVTSLQLLLSYQLFRIRRLKNGMPFLTKIGSSEGVLISLILICSFICISNVYFSELCFFMFLISFILLGSVFAFVWWQNCLTKNYLEKLKSNEFQQLQGTLEEQQEEIHRLKESNDQLAKLIHKDNKLIPAMELAVKEYLEQSESEKYSERNSEGHMLLEELRSIFDERADALKSFSFCQKALPVSGVFQIDSLLRYMYCKAQGADIQLKFTSYASMQYLTENIISTSDLRTILADLLENAIIAVKSSNAKNRKILIVLEVVNQSYEIEIYDSGIPFKRKTIHCLGKRNNTTHAADGGSGIGLPTVLETLRYYKASFYIQEFRNVNDAFTKKVSIKFDGLNQCIAQTDSKEIINIIPAAYYLDVQANEKLIS